MNRQLRLTLLLTLLLASTARAVPEPGSGTLFLPAEDGATPVAAPVVATEVHMDIVAMSARVKVGQTFRNPGEHWTEGIYVFPLPDNAAVDHLRMRVGERVIEGEIQERGEARKTYEQAKTNGRRSSLVEQQRPNIFTASVANIDPHGEIRVEIEYQQPIEYRDGAFSLRFPMVVAPRYIPGSPIREQVLVSAGWSPDTDQVPDASCITPPVRNPTAAASLDGSAEGDAQQTHNPVSLAIDLSPGLPVVELSSSYHLVHIEQTGDADNPRFHIRLAEEEVPADRDFELVWRPETGHAPRAALFTEQQGGDTYALLMLTPPGAKALEGQRPARDLSFVIDTSGSMYGDSMEQARQAVIHALRRLSPADRFNVIEFNNSARRLYPTLTAATPAHIARAVAWVGALSADGGTEMASALRLALPEAETETAGRLHQVVFLTDGAVGNEAALFRLIRQRLGHSRLFPVGIGSAPNSYFMRKAAAFGRGSFTHIGSPDEVLTKMDALLRRLEYPALTGLRLQLPEDYAAEVYPDPLPDLYLGEPVQIALRLARLPDTLSIGGRFGNRPWRAELALDQPRSGNGIRGLWARRRIAGLTDALHQSSDANDQAALREQILDTALGYHLVSEFTSLVAVDQTPARPNGAALDAHPVATNLPRGWTYEKVFGLARGATPANLQLLLGLGLLLAAGVIRLLDKQLRPETPR